MYNGNSFLVNILVSYESYDKTFCYSYSGFMIVTIILNKINFPSGW